MKFLAQSIAILLLAGCALTTPPASKTPAPLSRQNWQVLQPYLKKAPEVIQKAIHTAALARLESEGSTSTTSMTAADTFFDLLSHSEQPLLHADDKFTHFKQMVLGSQSAPASPYAQALTDLIFQPDFNCRQPLYFKYFQHRYQTNTSPCATPVPFLLLNRHEGTKAIWLPPQRVSSIHLVFAGQGPNMASRFGHVALRLVVCPEGKSSKEACDSNLFEHIILGFAAHIDEFELNTFKALSGDYKAYLFATPFMDAYRNYAISEFREITSIPLALNDSQRQLLVRQLSEIHWRYSGDYNFFTRNCSTLLQQALRTLIPQFGQHPGLADDYMRPDYFFAAIQKTSMVDGDKLTSLEQAEQQGFFFSSTKPFYDQALQVVMAAMGSPSFSDIDSYLHRLPSQRLNEIFMNQGYVEILSSDPYHLEAQLLLEELALVRSERLLMAKGSLYFQSLDINAEFDQQQSTLDNKQWRLFTDCFLRPIQQISQPIPRLQAIPQQSDALPTMPLNRDCHTTASREQLSDILDIINTKEQEQWQQVLAAAHILDETTQNILILTELTNESH